MLKMPVRHTSHRLNTNDATEITSSLTAFTLLFIFIGNMWEQTGFEMTGLPVAVSVHTP
jgi:hypothetical protein